MKTLGEVLRLTSHFLQERGVLRPRLSAELLLAHLLKLKRLELYLQFDRPLEEAELAAYRECIKRRAKGEPVEYITGEVEFAGALLSLSSAVLIPRPETEILLDLVVRSFLPEEGQTALDLCTGSGCLAIGLKKHHPLLKVCASDLSDEALQLARVNAQNAQVEIDFRQGDLTAPWKGSVFDYILCNPPYISTDVHASLHREVRDFEPSCALIGGETGLEFYRRLRDELPSLLKPGARLFFEIGADQGESVKILFQGLGWKEATIQKDWAGNDRFLFCRWEN